jgi:hypothetical protein
VDGRPTDRYGHEVIVLTEAEARHLALAAGLRVEPDTDPEPAPDEPAPEEG